MGGATGLQPLVELAYSAAVEDSLWRDWTFALADHFASPGALFWVIDNQRFDMCQNHMCFRDVDNAAVTAEYLSGPVDRDPQMTRVCGAKQSEIYLDTDHVDLEDAATREYVLWQEATVGSVHHITTSVVLADGIEAGVSLHRSRAQGPAHAELQAQIQALFPEFGRALRLGYRHADAIQESWWDGLSGRGDEARVLLTRGGRVLRANAAARAIFDRKDGLHVSHDRFTCIDPKSEEALHKAVSNACDGATPGGSSLAIRRKGGRAPYLVSVYPLLERRRFLAPFGATALLSIADPAPRLARLSRQQQVMLRLTDREAELAGHMRNGHSLASAAEMLGISYNTARVHLSALFEKTNTNRQTDLILMLERLV